MQVKHAVELEDGSYTYQGNLEGAELKFLVEYAINRLLMEGALPFLHESSEATDSLVMPTSNTEQ